MSPQAGRRAQPASSDSLWLAIGGALVFVMAIAAIYWVSGVLDPVVSKSVAARDPFTIFLAQVSGNVPVTGRQVIIIILGVVLMLAFVALLVFAWWRQEHSAGSTRVDSKARSMARVKDVSELLGKKADAEAERFGVAHGVPLGRLVNNNQPLFASWEWVQTWIMGPRAGKTTCVCIPQIVETDGPVVATSNKRDIVDLTRGPRSEKGNVWVHDVQGIIGEEPSWYWNPLSFVEDMETAQKLADIFVTSVTSADAREDAYFGPGAKSLLARYLLAAAVGNRPITKIPEWVSMPEDLTAVRLLREHGYMQEASLLEKDQNLNPKQRDGLYGSVGTWVSVLANPKVVPWIRKTADLGRPEFDVDRFVRSADTIYLVSREGGGSARALTAALAMAILTRAEKIAAGQPGGRLASPLMAVLDETANVVRWSELPDLYSHYGSRGIIVSTFFQSFTQGVEAFGKEGMRKLWSAANIRVAGSGLSEDEFLPFLSNLIGTHDVVKRTSSTQRDHRSVSTSVQRENIFEVSELAALPRGRAVLSSSGMPTLLMKLEHYSKKDYEDAIKASREAFEPKGTSEVPA